MPDDSPTFTQQDSPQVQPGASLPGVSSAASGQGVADAVGNAAMVARRIEFDQARQQREQQQQDQEQQARHDRLAGIDASTGIQTDFIKATLGPQGIMTQPAGKDAPLMANAVLKQYDDQVSAARVKLPSDEAREAFDLRMAEHRQGVVDQLTRWQGKETDLYAQQVHKARVDLAGNEALSAIAQTNDPMAMEQGFNRALARGNMAIIDGMHGQPDEVVKAATDDWTSKTTYGALEAMSASGDHVHAAQFYATHRDDLKGEEAVRAERLIAAGNQNGEAQRQAVALMHDAKGNLRSETDFMGDALKIEDPDLQEKVLARGSRMYAQAKQAHAEQQEALANQATDIIRASPQGIDDPRVQAMRGNLDRQTWDALQQEQDRTTKANRASSEAQVEGRLYQMVATPEGQEALKNLSPTDRIILRPQMSKEAYESWFGPNGNIAQLQGGKVTDGAAKILSVADVMKGGLSSAGINEEKHPDQAAAFRADFAQRVQVQEARTGKPMDTPSMQKLMGDMLLDRVRTGGGWFSSGSQTLPSRAKPEDLSTATVTDGDLQAMRTANPAALASLKRNLRSQAEALGVNADALSGDQVRRVYAQALIERDALMRGDDRGAREARQRMNQILGEAYAPPAPPPAPVVVKPTLRAGGAQMRVSGGVEPGSEPMPQWQQMLLRFSDPMAQTGDRK